MRGERLGAPAALDEPRCAVAVGGPEPATLPAHLRIVDAPVEAFGVVAHRIRHAQRDHAAVGVGDETVVQVAGGHRYVVAEAERVVLVDPRVVARLGAVLADAAEARAGILVERPSLGAVTAGGIRPVERRLALAA